MIFYNKFDENGIGIGTLLSHRPINQDDMIISESHTDHTGQHWTGEVWEDVPEGDPVPETILAYDFYRRFTLAIKIAIEESTDSGVKVFRKDLEAAISNKRSFEKNNPDLVAGIDYLVAEGIITPAQKAEILDF